MLKALKVRLRDILDVDLLAGAEVIAGETGMDNVITLWEITRNSPGIF